MKLIVHNCFCCLCQPLSNSILVLPYRLLPNCSAWKGLVSVMHPFGIFPHDSRGKYKLCISYVKFVRGWLYNLCTIFLASLTTAISCMSSELKNVLKKKQKVPVYLETQFKSKIYRSLMIMIKTSVHDS